MATITYDNYLDGITKLALSLPTKPEYYARRVNKVRDFLLDLADCGRALLLVEEERKAVRRATKPKSRK